MTDDARDALVQAGRSLFDRGLTPGRTGNLSVRVDAGWLVTPTGVSLGRLAASGLSSVDASWTLLDGPRPTKEVPVHRAMYDAIPSLGAVIHLHSPHAVALSCLPAADTERHVAPIPPLTAYFVMKVGEVAWIPYHRPGDPALEASVRTHLDGRHAALLANHGPVVGAADLDGALDAIEELEATARVQLLLGERSARPLTLQQIDELRRSY